MELIERKRIRKDLGRSENTILKLLTTNLLLK